MAQQITIEIKLIKIGSGFIAATSLAGITIRGPRRTDSLSAVRSLLYSMQSDDNDDASIALDLALEGTTFDAAAELTSGE